MPSGRSCRSHVSDAHSSCCALPASFYLVLKLIDLAIGVESDDPMTPIKSCMSWNGSDRFTRLRLSVLSNLHLPLSHDLVHIFFTTLHHSCMCPCNTATHWVGDGFHVYPVFAGKAFTQELSPFLMFDYAAPKSFLPNEGNPKGVGRHPHRGFSTVTIAFKGEVEHADSVGNRGVIKPGDCQWMTAGRGIIHEEYHSTEFSKRGDAS